MNAQPRSRGGQGGVVPVDVFGAVGVDEAAADLGLLLGNMFPYRRLRVKPRAMSLRLRKK